MRHVRRLLTAALGLALTGCPHTNPIECVDNTSCDLSPGGVCTVAASGNQWCAYPDLTCPGGMRYSDLHVGDGLSGACVNADVDAGGGDITPPTVVSHTPTDLAANVPIGAAVTATFSEAVLASSVTTTTFSVRAGAMPVAGSLAVVGATASFVPTARLSPAIDYTAVLSTGITDLAGNPMRAEIRWTFRTSTGGWTQRQLLESDLTHAANTLKVAFSANGHGIATWYLDRAYAAIYAGGAWTQGAPISLATTNRPAAVAIDSQGRATALLAAGGQLQAATFAAAAWGAPVEIDSGTGNIGTVAVATDDAGNAVAVWAQSDGSVPSIWANRYVVGTGWGTAVNLESAPASAFGPSLAVLPDGTAFALWSQNNLVMSARMSAAGVWAPATQVGAGTFAPPTVAAGPGGALIALWPSGAQLQAARYNGAWGAPTTINGGTGDPFNGSPRLAFLASGKALALWTAGTPGFQNLVHAVFTAASGWGPAQTIDVLAGSVNNQSIVAGAGDLAMAGWAQPQGVAGARDSGWASVFDGTTGWGEPQLFEMDEAGVVTEAATYYDGGTNTFGALWIQPGNGSLASVFFSELR